MNFRQLELFLAAADVGGFTSAAAREKTSQPAVSAAVRRLEDELEALLFVRGSRPLTLTTEGEVLRRRAQGVFTSLTDARNEIRALAGGDAGEVRFGAPPMLAGYILPPVLRDFVERRPAVALRMREEGAERLRESVSSGELDFGLIADWREDPELTVTPLRPLRMVAWICADAAAGRDRIAWDELLDMPLILFPSGFFQRLRAEHAARARGRRLTIAVETQSVALIGALAAAGLGAATVLDALPPPDGVAAVSITSEAEIPLALCRRAGFPVSGAADRLFDQIAASLS